MLELIYKTQFLRDAKLAHKRGKDISKLEEVLALLQADMPLPTKLKDHPLKGKWKNWRDIHIAPDWILIYRIVDNQLILARTGTHSDLFDD